MPSRKDSYFVRTTVSAKKRTHIQLMRVTYLAMCYEDLVRARKLHPCGRLEHEASLFLGVGVMFVLTLYGLTKKIFDKCSYVRISHDKSRTWN